MIQHESLFPAKPNFVARSMQKMLDGVLETDAGGGGVIGSRILDEGCWLSLSMMYIIYSCIGRPSRKTVDAS